MTHRHAPAGTAPVPGSRTRQHTLAARCMTRAAARDLQAARALVRALADGRRSAALKAAVRRALRDYPELAEHVRWAERVAEGSPAGIARRLAAGRRRDAKRDAEIAVYLDRQKRRKAAKRRTADLKSDGRSPEHPKHHRNSGGTPPKKLASLKSGHAQVTPR